MEKIQNNMRSMLPSMENRDSPLLHNCTYKPHIPTSHTQKNRMIHTKMIIVATTGLLIMKAP